MFMHGPYLKQLQPLCMQFMVYDHKQANIRNAAMLVRGLLRLTQTNHWTAFKFEPASLQVSFL